jgi:PST family polysaccharide transporter
MFCYLVLRGAGQVQYAVLQRDLRFRERTVIDITRSVTRGVASIVLALDDRGVWALVIGLLVGEAAGLVPSNLFVRLRPTLHVPRAVVRSLLQFGVAVLGLKVVGSVYNSSDILIVGHRLGATQLGLYSMALRLPELFIDSVHWIFSSVAFSFYSNARLQGAEAFRRSMLKALRLTTLFGFSAGTGLAILAPTAVPLLFSARWQEAVTPAVLLSLASGIGSIGYASGDIFPATGRPGVLLRLTAGMTAVAIVGFYLAAPHGLAAVAVVHLVFQVAFGLQRLRAANRLLGVTWPQDLAAMAPSVATAAGVAVLALPVSLLLPRDAVGLLLTVLAGVVGAAVALFLTDRELVRGLAGRLRRGVT